ncbi:MAG: transposase [Candidatus Freyarchaeota archaeon]
MGTICRRVNSLDISLNPNIDREQDLVIALDASGIKVTNRGEWMRRRWKARRGYLMVHLAVDVRSKQILSMKVTDEKVGDGRMPKPLVKNAQKHGEVKRALADGGYDSKENFNFLAEEYIDPAIKVRKNSSNKLEDAGLGRL